MLKSITTIPPTLKLHWKFLENTAWFVDITTKIQHSKKCLATSHLYLQFSLLSGFWHHFAQKNDTKKEIKILNFGI